MEESNEGLLKNVKGLRSERMYVVCQPSFFMTDSIEDTSVEHISGFLPFLRAFGQVRLVRQYCGISTDLHGAHHYTPPHTTTPPPHPTTPPPHPTTPPHTTPHHTTPLPTFTTQSPASSYYAMGLHLAHFHASLLKHVIDSEESSEHCTLPHD